ncbi:hypothetical protein HK104_004217, partial [Borealophlyctis nickersoniae]
MVVFGFELLLVKGGGSEEPGLAAKFCSLFEERLTGRPTFFFRKGSIRVVNIEVGDMVDIIE